MDQGASSSWLSNMFFREYQLTHPEFVTARYFYDQSVLDCGHPRVKLYFQFGSAQSLLKEDLVNSLKCVCHYLGKSTSAGNFRTFYNRLSPSNLSSVGVKYLVVVKELLDRLSALLYGLEWDVKPDDSLDDHAVIWKTLRNQDIIFVKVFLHELIGDLSLDEVLESSSFQTPTKQTSIVQSFISGAPSAD